jgi:hypothetical protein
MVVVLMLFASIGSLNVTVMFGAVVETPPAPFGGFVEITVGAVSSAVVNAQLTFAASATPCVSFTPVVTVAVMLVELGILLVGVNSAILVAAV